MDGGDVDGQEKCVDDDVGKPLHWRRSSCAADSSESPLGPSSALIGSIVDAFPSAARSSSAVTSPPPSARSSSARRLLLGVVTGDAGRSSVLIAGSFVPEGGLSMVVPCFIPLLVGASPLFSGEAARHLPIFAPIFVSAPRNCDASSWCAPAAGVNAAATVVGSDEGSRL